LACAAYVAIDAIRKSSSAICCDAQDRVGCDKCGKIFLSCEGDGVRRRDFITFLFSAAWAWPHAARAQQGRTYRIGSLHLFPRRTPFYDAFFDELRRLGFIEGQNLSVDQSGYGLRPEQLSEHASALVKAQVDVIVAGGDAAIRAAQKATDTIPILAMTDDMVGSGLVSSLAKPGGNTTGVSLLMSDLDGKRQDILIEVLPGLRHMAALADSNTTAPQELQALQDAARIRGVAVSIHQVAKTDEIAPAIEAAKTSGAAALNVLASPFLFANRQAIIEHAAAERLPAIYQWPDEAEQGGLIGYGPRLVQLYRDIMARQLVKLLRGTKPADLPIEQPTRFELVINLKTAKALGIALPESFLIRADKVVE
jgi:putative tryptophan/tyrosine transport system substrate-binding protein